METIPQVVDGSTLLIPSIRGVNLGGWLVLEEWITPSLFATFHKAADQVFHDGCRFSLQSSFGKWVCAEDGGGSEVIADRAAPGDNEIFTVNMMSDGSVRFS